MATKIRKNKSQKPLTFKQIQTLERAKVQVISEIENSLEEINGIGKSIQAHQKLYGLLVNGEYKKAKKFADKNDEISWDVYSVFDEDEQ